MGFCKSREKCTAWENWADCPFHSWHFLRAVRQRNVIIFKLLPVAMWLSLSSLRCFANISFLGQATNSICAQLNPHKTVSLTNYCFFPPQPREMPDWAIFTFGGKCSIWTDAQLRGKYPDVLFLSHGWTLESCASDLIIMIKIANFVCYRHATWIISSICHTSAQAATVIICTFYVGEPRLRKAK